MRSRNEVVKLAESWIGKKESDGSFKSIIDTYNSYNPLPRGIKMTYTWAWCACTWSALAIKLGYTDIMPIEISCGYLINAANLMGCWQEKDNYIPKPGDAVLYDWQDDGKGDNTGWPDHVGTVTYCNPDSGYFVVTEGNYSNSVKKRTVSINGKGIRGFITPNYDEDDISLSDKSGKDLKTVAHEVIAGMWDNGKSRQAALTNNGYDYKEVQEEVNRILNGSAAIAKDPIQDQNQPVEKKVVSTCYAKSFLQTVAGVYKTEANLYLRNDAGTNKKALCLIPKGTNVRCYGYYTKVGNTIWPYIEVNIDGVQYVGFSSVDYLTK